MTDKERLEDIKEKYMEHEYDFNLIKNDINFLIEQAERVNTLNEQLETALKTKDQAISYNATLENQIDITQARNEDLEEHVKDLKIMLKVLGERNERYKHALQFGVKYLQNSNIIQIQLVVSALKNALEDGEE